MIEPIKFSEMSNEDRKEMEEIANTVRKDLAKKGIYVDMMAAFKIDSNEKTPTGKGLVNPKYNADPKADKGEQGQDECYCPACLNWDNFEEVLGKKENSKFEYSNFEVAGKKFLVKYWSNGEDERIALKDESQTLTDIKEQLQVALEIAIEKGDMEAARAILGNIKNKK